MSPIAGSEMQDFFQFSTSRWTDDELPLSYAFGYFSGSSLENMLELQGRGESSFLGEKYLPRGAEANEFNLTCGGYAFNALDARSRRTFSVKVLPVQVSAEEFGASVLSQLEAVSDHQDTSAVKSIVSVGISILNAANCSLAPSDCAGSLGREACADTPHTCGPCLEGYLGESTGDGNSPCYTIVVESTGEDVVALQNGTCVVSTDCQAMQNCDEGVCVYAKKSCPSDCSGKGRCQLELKASGAEVDECLINEFTCQARCICEEGFLGSGCSETRSAMEAKQQTRYQFISYINSTMKNEDMNSASLTAQIVLIMDLGSNPSELLDVSCTILQYIIDTIFRAAAEVDVPISTLEGLLGVLDNCDQVYVDATSADNAHRLDTNKQLRDSFSGLASKAMIVGEKDKEFIDTYSRSTISKNNIADASEQVVPQTPLEKIFSIMKSSLQLDEVTDTGSDITRAKSIASDATRSVYLEESELSLFTNNSGFSANPLKVQYFLSLSSDQDDAANRLIRNSESQFVLLVFQNNAPQEYITNSSNGGGTGNSTTLSPRFVTNCGNVTASADMVGISSGVYNYTCPGGQVVSHVCSDAREVITSVCPATRRLPVCRILSSNDNNAPSSCNVVSFTATNVTCNCSVLLEQSSNGGDRRLSSSSGLESSGYVEMVSMTEYTYEGFIETNSEISDISIGDVKNGLIVIIMFSTLWGCGILGLYELFKSSYCDCYAKVQPKERTRERRHTDSVREVSLDTKKEHLLKYIDEILPTIFRSTVVHDTTLQSMWRTIKTYHPYAVVFTAEGPGAKELKIQKGIYLLTIQAMLMFIMAVFCDLQVYLRCMVLFLLCLYFCSCLICYVCVLCSSFLKMTGTVVVC